MQLTINSQLDIARLLADSIRAKQYLSASAISGCADCCRSKALILR